MGVRGKQSEVVLAGASVEVAEAVRVRSLAARDRARIREIVIAAGNFTPVEVETALELVDKALAGGEEESGYLFVLLEEGEAGSAAVRGYACYGPTPLTDGVYDLYWIVVDPAAQGRGCGKRLLASVEEAVAGRGGRKLLIETSSQESYAGTTRFYERSGYALEARVRDFYKVGDDKLIFAKDFPRRG